MRRTGIGLWLVGVGLWAACSPCPPLADVPVRGGAPAARAGVRAELVALAEELALGVCIDHVRVDASMRADRGGTYDPVLRGVRLSDTLAPDERRWTLRHEVCHGIDVQNALLRELDDDTVFAYADAEPPLREGRIAAEAFAATCELGRDLLALTRGDCPGDPDLRGVRFVEDRVFAGAAPAPAVRAVRIAAYDVGYEPDVVTAVQAARDGHLVVSVDGGPGVLVDAFTGAPVEGIAAPRVTLDDGGEPEPSPPRWRAVEGGETDTIAVSATWLAQPTGTVFRALGRTSGWSGAVGLDGTPCWTAAALFPYDGEWWSAAPDARGVVWGRWTADSD